MEKYIIEGGTPLNGDVVISGAKNAALGIIAGALLTDEEVILDNLPQVHDIEVMLKSAAELGCKVEYKNSHCVSIIAKDVTSSSVTNEYLKKIRASYYFLGALLGKLKKSTVPRPGGCAIGERPIDQHLKGFSALGASCIQTEEIVSVKAEKLKGADIYLDVVSVGATINIMLAACLAEGVTTIDNVAKEPHVVDVANFLNSMGAQIKGAGTDTIRITGVEKLHKTEYMVIPDQIEAGTYMCAAAITGGKVRVKNVIPKHLESISSKLIELGCIVKIKGDSITVNRNGRLKSVDVKTLPYPGFPTDMQAQITTLLAIADSHSTVVESIFEARFSYVKELNEKMGANIIVKNNVAEVSGVEVLNPAVLVAPDLRAGAALVLAALSAKGTSEVKNIHFVQRGYENFVEKLRGIGANIKQVPDEASDTNS